MRLTPDTVALLDQLATTMAVSRGQLVTLAIKRLAGHLRIVATAQAPAQLPGQLAVEDLQQPQK
jgi:hypothetical protein